MDITEELQDFLYDINMTDGEHLLYLNEDDYEDLYNRTEIREAQEKVAVYIKDYLHKKYPGIWCVYYDWAVHVVKADCVKTEYPLIVEKYLVV